jgi:hypothetical protein
MTDKIILNIQHSDDYTDYLLMTAGLTNKRIIPMVNPGSEKLQAATDGNTEVLRCCISRDTAYDWCGPVARDPETGSIRIYSHYYLEDDGSINYGHAETVRQTVEEMAMRILMSSENLREAYRLYFPVFWSNRDKIYADPKLFFVDSGHIGSLFSGDYMPVGAILKAMDEDPSLFRIRLGGGCSCGQRPLLVDYDEVYGQNWIIYTWCPECGSRREIRAWNFLRSYKCEKAMDDASLYYCKGRAVSPLSLFDLADELRST